MVELFVADATEDGGIGNLVAIEMQDRQNNLIRGRIQELIGVPARRECPRFRLAVTDDTGDNQIRIVERCSIGMRDGAAEFAPFVNGAGCLRRDVTWNASG